MCEKSLKKKKFVPTYLLRHAKMKNEEKIDYRREKLNPHSHINADTTAHRHATAFPVQNKYPQRQEFTCAGPEIAQPSLVGSQNQLLTELAPAYVHWIAHVRIERLPSPLGHTRRNTVHRHRKYQAMHTE